MFEKVSYDVFKRACLQMHVMEDITQVKKAYENLKAPLRMNPKSAGYKFFLPYNVALNPGEVVPLVTGFRANMESVYATLRTGDAQKTSRSLTPEKVSKTMDVVEAPVFLGVYPMESLIRRGIMYLNPVKIIDQMSMKNPKTEGLIVVEITFMAPPSGYALELPAGTPIAQGIIQPYFTMAINEETAHAGFKMDFHADDGAVMR